VKRTSIALALLLALTAAGAALAAKDDMDVNRLSNNLNQLSSDPSLGSYAQAEQARARDAIAQLAQARSRDRAYQLYIAERRVDLAKATAELQLTQHQLGQLDREHDQILLETSRREAEAARRELEHQRLQNQLAQEEAQRQQAEGQAATDQAVAQAEQAQKLAAAQAKVAAAARREAAAAAAAARAMRSQMESGDTPSSSKPRSGGNSQ
jgi:hypothetical protein